MRGEKKIALIHTFRKGTPEKGEKKNRPEEEAKQHGGDKTGKKGALPHYIFEES